MLTAAGCRIKVFSLQLIVTYLKVKQTVAYVIKATGTAINCKGIFGTVLIVTVFKATKPFGVFRNSFLTANIANLPNLSNWP